MKNKPPPPSPAEVARVIKALPSTADGKVIYPGMKVWIAIDYEPWSAVGAEEVFSVDHWGSVEIEGYGDYDTRPPADNRLYAKKSAALAECRRRNKPTTDGLTILNNRYPKAWKRIGAK